MKKWFLLCLLLLVVAVEGRAQDDSPATEVKPAPFQPVPYQRDLPNSVRQMMPSEAKSVFWGRFTPSNNGFSIAVHFYELWRGEENQARQSYGRGGANIHYAFDVFDNTKRLQPKLLNRVFVTVAGGIGRELYDVRFYWMNKEQTRPMFAIKTYEKGDYGFIGSENFVALGSGWVDSSTIDTFDFGSWHASNTGGQQNTVFTGTDGIARIRVVTFPATDEATEEDVNMNYRAVFVWDEHGFYPVSDMGKFIRYNIGWNGWSRVTLPK